MNESMAKRMKIAFYSSYHGSMTGGTNPAELS